MPIDVGTTRTFPYVRHASLPGPTLRTVTLYSLGAVPLGLLMLGVGLLTESQSTGLGGYEKVFESGTLLTYASLGLCLILTPFTAVFALGLVDMLPNRVSIRRGATVVRRELFSLVGIVSGALAVILGVCGYGNTFMHSQFTIQKYGFAGLAVGPGMLALAPAVFAGYLWNLLRRIRMTPEHLEYSRGLRVMTIPWDEIGDVITSNDIKDHVRERKYQDKYLPGGKVAIPEYLAESTWLPVWRDGDTPRLLLETDGFRVEPSALMTVILAMRDHPELRSALGTRESKRYFIGPPFRVRRDMYRNQVWWSAGSAPAGVAVDKNGIVAEFG